MQVSSWGARRDRKRDRWKLLHNLAREGADEEFLRMVTEQTAEAT
ncbi:MAG: hypothetical protein ACE10D_06670 [Planctomycetota bacterium]